MAELPPPETQAAPAPEPARRTVGAGATVTTAGSLATAAVGGVLGVVVARLLGPSETGVYNVAASTLLIFMSVSTLGINIGVTYYVARGQWRPADAFRQLQLAALVAGGLGAGAGALVALAGSDTLFKGISAGELVPVLIALPFALSWTFTSALALALDRYETYAAAALVTNVCALVLAAALTPALGVTGAVLALGGAHAVNALRLLFWGRRLGSPEPGWLRRSASELRRGLSFGLRGYLPQMLQLVNYRADLFILNSVAAKATVGRYAVALIVTEVGVLLPRALAAVVLPRVASLEGSAGAREQRFVIVKSVRHTVLLLPGSALVVAAGVLAIPLVFGPDFSGAVGPGLVLVPGVAAVGLSNVLWGTTIGKGKAAYALYGTLVITPATLGLYLWLVPALSAYGAALASSVSYAATLAMSFFFFARTTGIRRLGELMPGRAELGDYRVVAARARRRDSSAS